jgi:hypothetical protein
MEVIMHKKNGKISVINAQGNLVDVKKMSLLELMDTHTMNENKVETLLVMLREASLNDDGLENLEDFLFPYICETLDKFGNMKITRREMEDRLKKAEHSEKKKPELAAVQR